MTIADIGLLGSTDDATVWAKEFMKVVRHRWDGGTLPVNETLMEEWFGNLVVVAHRRANPHYYDGDRLTDAQLLAHGYVPGDRPAPFDGQEANDAD